MGTRTAAWRRALWRRPEWWTLGLSGLAWTALVARELRPHAAHHGNGLLASWLHWELMIVAMMLPFVADAVRLTAQKSLWPRRDRAIAGFLVGYLGPWTAAGLAVSAALALSGSPASPLAAAAGFALAAVWQLVPTRRRAARGCRLTMPLAPRGWRADRDCVRYGWRIGVACLTSCWALMLACALSGHHLLAMALCAAIGAADRFQRRADQRLLSATAGAAAGVCFAAALLVG